MPAPGATLRPTALQPITFQAYCRPWRTTGRAAPGVRAFQLLRGRPGLGKGALAISVRSPDGASLRVNGYILGRSCRAQLTGRRHGLSCCPQNRHLVSTGTVDQMSVRVEG